MLHRLLGMPPGPHIFWPSHAIPLRTFCSAALQTRHIFLSGIVHTLRAASPVRLVTKVVA